ncbi:MAG: hypothetical protein GY871_16115 [Actinomycetales bacterium]|nr:hypothetical protein [Actinomycetales bacterium]MCP4894058.1 hypothetical protein [Actinomycetales bacterium]
MERMSLAARMVPVWLAVWTESMKSGVARKDLTQEMSSRERPAWMAAS